MIVAEADRPVSDFPSSFALCLDSRNWDEVLDLGDTPPRIGILVGAAAVQEDSNNGSSRQSQSTAELGNNHCPTNDVTGGVIARQKGPL